MAKWQGRGLQNPHRRFDSASRLHASQRKTVDSTEFLAFPVVFLSCCRAHSSAQFCVLVSTTAAPRGRAMRVLVWQGTDRGDCALIRATTSIDGPPFTVVATVSGLAVYLDNWAVIDLAKGDPSRQRRFVNAICAGSDLLFSSANAAELSGPQGRSFDAVKSFLDQLGPHWVPVELNPFKVVEREWNGVSRAESCLSADFMHAYFRDRTTGFTSGSGKVIDLSQDFFRLGAVLDWVAQSDEIRKLSAEFDEVLKKAIREARGRKPMPAQPFTPSKPATFTCGNLLRTLIVEAKAYHVKKGDGLDFCHAVIGSAFASVAALDKHWKRRVASLPTPNGLARIYSKPELDAMVTDIESWVTQHGAALH